MFCLLLSAVLVIGSLGQRPSGCFRQCDRDSDCPVDGNFACLQRCCVRREAVVTSTESATFGRCRGLRTCANDLDCRGFGDRLDCIFGCCVAPRCPRDRLCSDRCCDPGEECRLGRCCDRLDDRCGREDRCSRLGLEPCRLDSCGRGFGCELGCCVQTELPVCPQDRQCRADCCRREEICVTPPPANPFCCDHDRKCGNFCCHRNQQCHFIRATRDLGCREARRRRPGALGLDDNDIQIIDE